MAVTEAQVPALETGTIVPRTGLKATARRCATASDQRHVCARRGRPGAMHEGRGDEKQGVREHMRAAGHGAAA